MFDIETRIAVAQIAKEMGVSAAALLAVAEVESGGKVFATVRGKQEPVIRFEGHYFDRFLRGEQKMEARAEGLAHPKAGKVKNPRSQVGRWKLLNRAIRINRTAALSSVSWGLGQVMGSHWQGLGYGSVDAMVNEARTSATGQVKLMARYIEKAGLVRALQKRDWTAFARRYNGPGFRRNKYDTKMATVFAKYAREELRPALPKIAETAAQGQTILMFGSRGVRVKQLQRHLTLKGYVLVADGLFGLITDRTVRQFQRDHFLEETGIVGTAEEVLIFGAVAPVMRRIDAARIVIALKASQAAQTAKKRAAGLKTKLRTKLRKGLLSISRRMA